VLSEQDVMKRAGARLRAEFSIDDSRIYILGDSMGGGWRRCTWAMKYPERWAAIAAAAPSRVRRDSRNDRGGLRTVPTFMIHGAADAAVPGGMGTALGPAHERAWASVRVPPKSLVARTPHR